MANAPLAEKLRPKKLSEFIGQEYLVGQNGIITKLLTNKLTNNYFPSLIFWGPPGSGKTTLAQIIALETKADFIQISAVASNTAEVKKIISLEEMINTMAARISQAFKMSFREFSGKKERGEIIVSFLALLELVKQGILKAEQEAHFGDITLESDSVSTPNYGPVRSSDK